MISMNCGPNFSVSKDRIRKRTNLPAKIAARKWLKRISKAAAANTKSLNGVGGGSMAGNISAQNSCLSKEAWIWPKRSRREPLAQQDLAAGVTDEVENDASNRRTCGSQDNVEEKSGRVLVDVARNDRIHGQAEEGRVNRCDDEHAPGAERREKGPQPLGVARKNAFDRVQRKKVVYAKGRAPVSGERNFETRKPGRWTLPG